MVRAIIYHGWYADWHSIFSLLDAAWLALQCLLLWQRQGILLRLWRVQQQYLTLVLVSKSPRIPLGFCESSASTSILKSTALSRLISR